MVTTDSSLFALTGDALRLQAKIDQTAELLFSDDLAEAEEARATLENLIASEADNLQAVEAKADAWCWVIDGIRARAAAQAAHAQRLKDLATEAKQRADVLQDRLVDALGKIKPDKTKWDLPSHKLTSRRSTAVELDPDLDPMDLREDLRRVKYEANKAAIKETIVAAIAKATKGLSGDEAAATAATVATTAIKGAQLIERRNWTIK
jgi:chromosome segregation ATPase